MSHVTSDAPSPDPMMCEAVALQLFRLSRPCIIRKSFGCSNQGIWVRHGCRGRFLWRNRNMSALVTCAPSPFRRGVLASCSPSTPADRSDPSRVLIYLRSVFRDPRVMSWAHEQAERMFGSLSWLYHAPAAGVVLHCAHKYHSAVGTLCGQSRRREGTVPFPPNPHALTHGLVLCPPIKLRTLHWFGFWRPPADVCQPLGTSTRWVADDTWIEVTRVSAAAIAGVGGNTARRFGEGGGAGCWFLVARGSGVFLHTGRSLRVSNRSRLLQLLSHGGISRQARARQAPFPEMWDSFRLCEGARLRGYHTVQLADPQCSEARPLDGPGTSHRGACWLEIVSCHTACMAQPTRRYYGTCIPGLPLRTGWDASLPCACDDSVALVNCLGTDADAPPPTKALLQPFNASQRHTLVGTYSWPAASEPFRADVTAACELPVQQMACASVPRT